MSSHAPAHSVAPADLAAPFTVVHKFGGTSVADAERYRHVGGLLLARPESLQVTVVDRTISADEPNLETKVNARVDEILGEILTDDMVELSDSSTKINPPLRQQKDVEAVLEGLKDGTIDCIVTDHSPHAQEEKDREYIYAPSGFPGLETALGVLMTDLVDKGKLDAEPAKIFGLKAGSLKAGMPADVTVIDPELCWTVDEKKFYTKGSHSPFIGRELKGKAVKTFVDGKLVMDDGVILEV